MSVIPVSIPYTVLVKWIWITQVNWIPYTVSYKVTLHSVWMPLVMKMMTRPQHYRSRMMTVTLITQLKMMELHLNLEKVQV